MRKGCDAAWQRYTGDEVKRRDHEANQQREQRGNVLQKKLATVAKRLLTKTVATPWKARQTNVSKEI